MCCDPFTTMSWIQLPIELRVIILSIRYTLREEAERTIVKYWDKFKAPKLVAQYLIEKDDFRLRNNNRLVINIFLPDTANIMEYCAKVLSGKEKPDYWNMILNEVEYELWHNEYSGGPGASNLSRTNNAFVKLVKKFNYTPTLIEFDDIYN